MYGKPVIIDALQYFFTVVIVSGLAIPPNLFVVFVRSRAECFRLRCISEI